MRYLSLGLALLVAGCEGDTNLIVDQPPEVIANVPDLCTPSKTDRITQVDEPKVDVLWVIDNSGSMSEEQNLIADNFTEFIQFFLESGLDWHMGVITTDTDNDANAGLLWSAGGYNYISRDTPNAEDVFGNIVLAAGTNGSATERGRQAVDRFFGKLNNQNRGFYRDEAAFHVIVVSDEDDQSGNDPSLNEFINTLRNLKEEPDMVSFSSIVGDTPTGCNGPNGGADAGGGYIAVTNQLNGIFESICEEDWVPVLQELGLQAAGMRLEYFLSEVPVPGTIEVKIEVPSDNGEPYVYNGVDMALLEDGSPITDHCDTGLCFQFQYSASRNSIYIEGYVPPALSVIDAEYKLLSEWQPDACDDEGDIVVD